MERILIIGCPGSGKSTLARALAARTGLPPVHLDNLWWRPDRTHITREQFDAALEQVLREERWIIDGDYSRTYEVRIAACDTVIFLDYGREICLEGITARVGQNRDDIPWADAGPDPALVQRVKAYDRENRPRVLALLAQYPDKTVLVFRTRAQAEAWLAGM